MGGRLDPWRPQRPRRHCRRLPGWDAADQASNSYDRIGGLNHIALVVEDLDDIEQRVIAGGFEPTNHGDYEPGRRFYFWDHDGVEYEIVSYR